MREGAMGKVDSAALVTVYLGMLCGVAKTVNIILPVSLP